MLRLLIENALLTSIYNQSNNGKKLCDYKCGEKVINDANRNAKLRLCKARCDVVWDQFYLNKLQEAVNKNPTDQNLRLASVEKIKFARRRLAGSRKRFMVAKLSLQKRSSKLPADLSMRVAKPSPAFSR